MRTPPLLADFIHAWVRKPICAKLLTLPPQTNLRKTLDTTNLVLELYYGYCKIKTSFLYDRYRDEQNILI